MDRTAFAGHEVDPALMRLARHCVKLAGTNKMPHYRDFHPSDVSWLMGLIYVLDVLDGCTDFRFRLLGAALTGLHGRDDTGRLLSEIRQPSLIEPLFAELSVVVPRCRMMHVRGKVVWESGESIGAEKLLVPMADDNGALSVIVGALHYQYPKEDWVLFKGNGVPQLEFDLQDAAFAEV